MVDKNYMKAPQGECRQIHVNQICYFFALWLASAFLLLAVTASLYKGSGVLFPDVWSFHVPWHVLDYSTFGFVKRGVLGTILLPFRPTDNLKVFTLEVYTFLALLLTGLTSYFIVSHKVPVYLSTAFILSPCTFMHFGFDSPRSSELLWLAFFMFSVLVAESMMQWQLKAICTSFFSCVALLTYEGSAFIILPSIALLLLATGKRHTWQQSIQIAVAFAIPIISTMALLAIHGSYEGEYSLLADKLSVLAPGADPAILAEVLQENLAQQNLALSYGARYTWFCNSLILLVYLTMWLGALISAIRRARGNLYALLFFITSLSGFLLCVVALDYARYCSLVLFASSILAISILKHDEMASYLPKRLFNLFSFMAFLGPVGVSPINPFPVLKQLFGGNIFPFF